MPSPKRVVVRLTVTRLVTTGYLAEMSTHEASALKQKLDSEDATEGYRLVRHDHNHQFDLKKPNTTFMRVPTGVSLKVLRANTREARSFRRRKV
jgi:hypothetical protein